MVRFGVVSRNGSVRLRAALIPLPFIFRAQGRYLEPASSEPKATFKNGAECGHLFTGFRNLLNEFHQAH